METHGATRFFPSRSPTSNRCLLRDDPPPPSDDDFAEDDIFSIDFSESTNIPQRHDGLHHIHHHHQTTTTNNNSSLSDSYGILAALPKLSIHSHLYHKPSISSSSSRPIPSLLKPTNERAMSFGKHNQHHSAPVKVPMLTNAMKKSRNWEEDEDEDEDMVGRKVFLAPHEIVDRRHSPAVACSVVEGAGRTLKGRDLSKVRNAVWRRTGFMD